MKTILVTGGSGSLGAAVINLFLSKEYSIIAAIRNETSRKELPQHQNLEAMVVDLADENQAGNFVKNSVEKYKKIDGALLLVGGFGAGNLAATGSNDIKKQIILNFDTAYHVARPVFRHMMENNDGRIVFIGSRPALQAQAGKDLIAYGLSKSLLFKLSEYLNAEAKGKNVTSAVVVPSTIDTEANRKSMPNSTADNWVKPEALAEILEFIISGKGDPLRETVLKVYNNA